MNPEYILFTSENPCDSLRTMAKGLPIKKKWKIAPFIRSAEMHVKKSKKFRDILADEDNLLYDVISSAFIVYFEAKVDRGRLVSIARDPAYDFVKFVSGMMKDGMRLDDKYLEKANILIITLSDEINAFIRAFISIRLATTELKKLSK